MIQDEIGRDKLPGEGRASTFTPSTTCTWAVLGAPNCSSSTAKAPREQRAHRVSHCAAFLSSFSVCSENHTLGKGREPEASLVLASNSSRLSLEGRGCQKHFTSHEKKASLQLFSEALSAAWLSTPKPPQHNTGGLPRKVRGKRGANRLQDCVPQGNCQIKEGQMISPCAGVCAC